MCRGFIACILLVSTSHTFGEVPPAASQEVASGVASTGEDEQAKHDPVPATEEEQERDLRSLFDPTVLARSVFFETQYTDLEHDAWTQEFNLGLAYAWGIARDADVGIRAVLPTTYEDPGRASGRGDVFGLSDVKLTPSIAYRVVPKLGQGFGLETTFDTSTEESIGSNSILLRPIYGIGYGLTEFLTMTCVVGYKASVWEKSGFDRTQVLDVSPAVDLSYPKAWRYFVGVAYKGSEDFRAGEYSNRLAVTAGKEIGTEQLFSLVAGCEFPLESKSNGVDVFLGISYFLR